MVAQELPYYIIAVITTELKRLLEAELLAKRQYIHASLAPYASINRSWNTVIERETFQSLSLSKGSMEYAERALSKNPARGSAVKQISFLMPYFGSRNRRRDLSERQLEERDAAFSEDLLRLFRLLESMDRAGSYVQKAQSLTLKLNITLDTLTPENKNGQAIKEYGSGSFYDPLDLHRGTYMSSHPGFYNEERDYGLKSGLAHLRYVREALPTVHCVKRFDLARNIQTLVWPSVVTTMVSVMDGLEHCSVALDDRRTANPSIRMEYRKALGENLCKILTTCEYFRGDFQNQSTGVDAQPAFGPGFLDILSISMRHLSMRLVELS